MTPRKWSIHHVMRPCVTHCCGTADGNPSASKSAVIVLEERLAAVSQLLADVEQRLLDSEAERRVFSSSNSELQAELQVHDRPDALSPPMLTVPPTPHLLGFPSLGFPLRGRTCFAVSCSSTCCPLACPWHGFVDARRSTHGAKPSTRSPRQQAQRWQT